MNNYIKQFLKVQLPKCLLLLHYYFRLYYFYLGLTSFVDLVE